MPRNRSKGLPPSPVGQLDTVSSSPGRLKTSPRSRDRTGIELRPHAVREARAASGLSLAEVAGAELTKAAIHRIENGQSRPSIRSLTLIAERTGKPLSFFLAGNESGTPAPELELERLSVAGEFDKVLARGTELIESGAAPDHELALIHYWIGEAHVRLTQPEAALGHLETAITVLDDNGDPWMAAHAVHMKSSALYLMDDPESKFVAEAALRRCLQLDPPEPMLEARVLNHLAAIAVNREEWQVAIRLYDRALAVAEPLRNLRQLSLMYEGLGMAYHHLGRAQQATGYFNRALGLYTLQSDMSSMARAETNLSQLLMDEGNLASAEEHLEKSLRYCDEAGVDRRNRTYALVFLAKLRLRQGRHAEADRLATSTIELGVERGEKLSVATALQVRGHLRARAGRLEESDAAFQRSIEIYESLNLLYRLRSCRIEYAEELDAHSRSIEARDQWRHAALVGRDPSSGSHERLASNA
jgi:tetratricopeptide (TPR) repeat protein/DNA-binding XRE family transcriptional regulator